jgi:hypothetical protein
MSFSIARLVSSSGAANTINIPIVEIFLQKSPNKPSGDKRGITTDFEVVKNGAVIQTGTTADDGKISMLVPGGAATLRVKAPGGAVAEYTVTIRNAAIEAVNTVEGVQRRLRMLGYHIGHTGTENVGVDGVAAPSKALDRAIQEFQADTPVLNGATANTIDSVANVSTHNALTAAAGA